MRRMRWLRRASVRGFVRDDRLASNQAFVEWLAFGFTMDRAAAYEQVRELESVVSAWQQEHGQWLTSASSDERDEFLDSLLVTVVADAVRRVGDRPAVLSLSGGYDSRAIAAVWPRAELEAISYGRPGSDDFEFARLLAQANAVRLRTFDVRHLPWPRASLLAEMAHQSDRQMSPRSVVQPILDSEFGAYGLAHGFANDVLTGARVPWPTDWNVAAASFITTMDRFGFQRFLPSEVLMGFLPAEPWTRGLSIEAQMIWVRQCERIRPVSTAARQMILPFADDRWRGFWLSQDQANRSGRRMWLEFLARRRPEWFPELATWDRQTPAKALASQWIAQHQPPLAASDRGPVRRHSDHCWRSSMRDNPSFRAFVDDCLGRLRARGVFAERFMDDRLAEWTAGTTLGLRSLRGLVSTEITLAAGYFA